MTENGVEQWTDWVDTACGAHATWLRRAWTNYTCRPPRNQTDEAAECRQKV